MEETNWTDIAVAAAAIATFAVLVAAVIVALCQIQIMRRASQAQLIAAMSRRWDEAQLMESRKKAGEYKNSEALRDIVKKTLEQGDRDTHNTFVQVPNFFETLGVLVEEKAISLNSVDKLLGSIVISGWNYWSHTVTYLQDYHKQRTVYENFQNLAERLRKRRGIT